MKKLPIIKEYEDFTEEEKTLRHSIWVEHLDKYCPSRKFIDEFGDEIDMGRPCDLGCLCDRCLYDLVILVPYTVSCVNRGVPITPDYEGYLSYTEYYKED